MVSEFLHFETIRDTGKTKFVAVMSRRQGNRLGMIHWYGPWRQYVMAPEPETVWNAGCLDDVNAFMRELMRERRKNA